MNYHAHYERLVNRARSRSLVGYSERHHVIPRCMGGTDVSENVVRLTAEEHFVAHKLLVLMHPGNHRLLWAASAMTNGTRTQSARRGNKLYGWLRREFSEVMRARSTGRIMSPEAVEKMAAAHRGVRRAPHIAATKAKMSAASKGKPKSMEHRKSMSAQRVGRKAAQRTPEWLANQRAGIIRAVATRDQSFMQKPAFRSTVSDNMKRVWALRRAGAMPMPLHSLPARG